MKELRRVLCGKNVGFVMTFETLPFGHMAISLDDAHVAFLAGNPSFDVLPVIEVPALDLNISLRFDVTGRATSYRAGNAILFTFRTGFIIVADKTVRLMDGEVQPLDNLGMARSAAKLHPSTKLSEVFAMREGDVFIDHVSLEVLGFVAPLLEAARVTDLGMGCARPLSRDEIRQGYLAIDPFPFEVVQKPGFIVTLRACHVAMAGDLP